MRKRNELPALDPSKFKVIENNRLTFLYGGGTCNSVTIVAHGKGKKGTTKTDENVPD